MRLATDGRCAQWRRGGTPVGEAQAAAERTLPGLVAGHDLLRGEIDDADVAFAVVHDVELRAVGREDGETGSLADRHRRRHGLVGGVDDGDVLRPAVRGRGPLAIGGHGHAAGALAQALELLHDGVGLAVNHVDGAVAVVVNPHLAVRREADADRPTLDGNDLGDDVGLGVDHQHAIVLAHRVVELVGPRLNRQEVTAAQHDVDLAEHLARLRVVDDDAGDVGVLEADVELAAIGGQGDAVRRGGALVQRRLEER